ncbi:MAG: type II toxin-antitoxin system RelE/ParE family toxin [Patescibacteria group bacterium]|nr:type II toxin-antitoxin system RelE/ParE family toxin [Patescibacteria group bacterium]
MEFQIRTKPSVEKELNKFTKADYYKILAAFTVLSKNPFMRKKMRGEYRECYNYRVWPYRIIYQVYKKELVILIIRVGHRQGVYK